MFTIRLIEPALTPLTLVLRPNVHNYNEYFLAYYNHLPSLSVEYLVVKKIVF